jgi:transposase
MMNFLSFEKILIHKGAVDFRKSINGLSEIVQSEMELDAFAKYLFVFASRDRKKIKMLYWDRTGFALWMKRLERAKFPWPKKLEGDVIELSSSELGWLLDGYEFWKMKPHEVVKYACVS